MARCSLRACALVALMLGVVLSPAAAARAQANDPFGAPPAAAPAAGAPPAAAPAAKAADPFGAPPPATPAPMSPGPRAAAPAASRPVTDASQAAEEGPFSAAAASAGLRTHGLAEQKILHALDDKTECDFTETPLADVIEYFKDHHHIEIQIDVKALQDEAVDTSVPVTRSLKGLKFRSALRLILANLNLAYVIRDEVLLITSRTEADALMETRTYPVQDLLVRWPTGPLRVGELIQAVTSTVQPVTWDENGGPGSIQPLPGALVIRQTQLVHEELAELFATFRKAKDAQAAEKAASRTARADNNKAKPPASAMRIAVHRVPNVDAEGLRTAIIALVAPSSWKESGGEGSIQVLHSPAPRVEAKAAQSAAGAPNQAPAPTAPTANPSGVVGASGCGFGMSWSQDEVLIVRQTDEVNEEIAELIEELSHAMSGFGGAAGSGSVHGTSAGLGGAGVGMGGGSGGGTSGGFFRVRK